MVIEEHRQDGHEPKTLEKLGPQQQFWMSDFLTQR